MLRISICFAFFLGLGLFTRAGQPGAIDRKFQFGRGTDAPGYTRISGETTYTRERGYGFEAGASVSDLELGGGACTSERPFFFSAEVPEGNYRVTVTLGNAGGESETTVKAELRRLMLEQVRVAPGETVQRSFIVNVRTPHIAGRRATKHGSGTIA
jgi:hypothetical protein